ncbi:MAG TPA: 4Fe-4S ferredoxin [Deltaproteobacteria bacterium]|nr:4Fe-4S ferredoxin [Deltaproteobacteria bacterium]
MDIESITCVYFSPTGTTRKIVENIAAGMHGERVEVFDCTKRSQRSGISRVFRDQVVILAAPVYYGRIPEPAIDCFTKISADKTPAVLLVVYGNRAYDDALIELHDIAVARGFIPIAAGAFIGEHSYSTEALPMATGRPDEEDLRAAREFGSAIRNKVLRIESLEATAPIHVPGHRPYVEPEGLYRLRKMRENAPVTPETDESLCTRCNVCIEACPQNAIDRIDVTKTDRSQCILCCACVKACPVGARRLIEPALLLLMRKIQELCRERKEREYYL